MTRKEELLKLLEFIESNKNNEDKFDELHRKFNSELFMESQKPEDRNLYFNGLRATQKYQLGPYLDLRYKKSTSKRQKNDYYATFASYFKDAVVDEIGRITD